jgi:hypothetical protein
MHCSLSQPLPTLLNHYHAAPFTPKHSSGLLVAIPSPATEHGRLLLVLPLPPSNIITQCRTPSTIRAIITTTRTGTTTTTIKTRQNYSSFPLLMLRMPLIGGGGPLALPLLPPPSPPHEPACRPRPPLLTTAKARPGDASYDVPLNMP